MLEVGIGGTPLEGERMPDSRDEIIQPKDEAGSNGSEKQKQLLSGGHMSIPSAQPGYLCDYAIAEYTMTWYTPQWHSHKGIIRRGMERAAPLLPVHPSNRAQYLSLSSST